MSAIYRAFDQATLDHQYNAQATVGDISPFIEMYTEGSARARAWPFEEALSFGASSEGNPGLISRWRRERLC